MKRDKLLLKSGLTSKISRERLDPFIARHASDKKTLDVGCTNGPYVKLFPNRIGIDIRKAKAVDIIADVHDLHMFKDNTFDIVLCTEVLEHLHTPSKAISEMKRVLKKGGKLILTTRFIFPLHDTPGDYYRFTREGLEFLLKDFKIEEFVEEANTIETVSILLQRIGMQCRTLRIRFLSLFWLVLARIVKLFSFMLSEQFGSVNQDEKSRVSNILVSGYYVCARKR